MSDCYILDDQGNPVPADTLEWGRWLETPAGRRGRIVAQDEWVGDARLISTVFLGLDHRFGGEGPPILWETMIFGGKHNDYQRRYTSRCQAVVGHEMAFALASGEPSWKRPWTWLKFKYNRLIGHRLMLWRLNRWTRKEQLRRASQS